MSGLRVAEHDLASPDRQVTEGARLILEEIEYRYSALPADEAAVREMIERCRSLDHRLYTVADRSGKIVAAAEVDQPEMEDAMVHNIAVQEDEQGHGIGRMLMRRIAERAAENGSEIIHIFPVETGFFEHIGFVTDPDDEAMMLASPEDILSA